VKTTRNLRFVAVVVCAVLLCGCTTPEARIKARPDVFARLTPDQQALVKAGMVAPGFDMDAVRLALGDPDRVMIETNASGQHEVWRYVTYGEDQGALYLDGFYVPYNVVGRPDFIGIPGYNNLYEGYPGRGWGDPYFRPSLAFYTYGTFRVRPHELIRVIFDTNGRVAIVRQRKP